jgi:protein ImuB
MRRYAVVHLACINLSRLPLQVLLRQEPPLREHPVAVVESGRAQARVLHVNARAWNRGTRPGMRQAAALAFVPDLQTRAVPDDAVRAATAQLTATLRTFTAHVEPDAADPGLFWLSAQGLGRLYRTPRAWSEALHTMLSDLGWQARIVTGFGHFTTQVIAKGPPLVLSKGRGQRKTSPRVTVFRSPAQEQAVAMQMPLQRCGVPVAALEALDQLGVRRLGDLLRLPAEGLLQRFGHELYRLHRLATGMLQDPLQPQAERLPVREWIFLEPPESNTEHLLFRIKGRLPFLLAPLVDRREALHTLHVHLLLDNRSRQRFEVQPARPTLQERLILELVRLRMERLALPAGVVEIQLEAESRPRELEQASLLPSAARRDVDTANRALAQVRAEFGDLSVVHAVPRQGHLPEARFAWEPLARLGLPHPQPAEHPTRVRRVLSKPLPLAGWSPDADGAPTLHGPFLVSGGWWEHEQAREYYLAESDTDAPRWIYRDRRLGQWFCQGWVE